MSSDAQTWIAGIIFAATYLGLAIGKVPGLRIDRAGIALVGATLMIVTGVVSLSDAVRSIDDQTILLLFGMMVVVSYLRLAGFFQRLAGWTLSRFRSPYGLLGVTIGLSGVLSAFLVNDIVCIALTPLVLHLTRRLRLDPLPHLLGLATAANVGSTATITGNPQNMIIGSLSNIAYLRFAARLAPVAIAGLLLTFFIIAWVFRSALRRPGDGEDLKPAQRARRGKRHHRAHNWLLGKSLTVTLASVVLFFAGLPIALVALGAAAILLMGRVRPEKVYRQVDWSLLVMFCGLFIVVHAFEVRLVRHWDLEHWGVLGGHPVTLLSLVSAGLSNLVSNVPAVLIFKPIIPAMPEAAQETAWLALAMSSTLAGNLTVLGSVANLIVVEGARREGITVSFWDYCKVGVPITLVTLAVGVMWLQWVVY
ncbi:MAG: anion transporter [Gemmataceae bacterium]|nr:anion transporter [Gemmataceae bacterium]